MSCRYGKYPFCKQCMNTGGRCADKNGEYEVIDENRAEIIKQVKEMLED